MNLGLCYLALLLFLKSFYPPCVLGKEVPSQVVTANTLTNYARDTNESSYVAIIQAPLAPLGAVYYHVKPVPLADPLAVSEEITRHDLTRDQAADIVLENELVTLTFSGSTGLLFSWFSKVSSTRILVSRLQHSMKTLLCSFFCVVWFSYLVLVLCVLFSLL